MSSKSVNFGDKKIKKSGFYKNVKVIKIDDVDVNKILVSKEESYGTKNSFKYFIGYIVEGSTTMFFMINNKELSKSNIV